MSARVEWADSGERARTALRARHSLRRRVARERLALLALLAAGAWPTLRPARAAGTLFRIGTTAVILDDQVNFLRAWQQYLEGHLHRPVQFVQRGAYQYITDLLASDQLDFAWVCGYPYVRNRAFMRLLAIPLYHGQPLYQSYLIVPASDTTTRGFGDLRGQVFAFSDPNSNSGYLVPTYEMLRAGIDPATLFRRSFFTWGHRKVVVAVASGLAQGGAVDGYVWETLTRTSPQLTTRTRVVRKSAEYGFPPVVARASISQSDFAAMQAALLGMSVDARGRELLTHLNLDGFMRDDPRVFDSIAEVMAYVDARQRRQA